MTNRFLAAVLTACVGFLLALVPVSAASAADDLGLSPDGVTWAGSLPAPLFDPAFRWVPGDVETASFFVRNQNSQAGILRVVMQDTAVRSLMETGDLEIAARVGDADWAVVTAAGEQTLIQDEQIPSGGVRRVDVRVSFDPLSPNDSQATRFDLRFDVNLSQDASVLPPDDGGNGGNGGGVAGPDQNGNLPGTGSTVSRGLLLLAVILCAGGLGLVGVGRRDRASKERQTTHA